MSDGNTSENVDKDVSGTPIKGIDSDGKAHLGDVSTNTTPPLSDNPSIVSVNNSDTPLNSDNSTSSVSKAPLGNDSSLSQIASVLNEIWATLEKLYLKEVVSETQLPPELLEGGVRRIFERRRRRRPLVEGEIRDACQRFKTMKNVMGYLGVGKATFKKYLHLYGIYEQYYKPSRGCKIGTQPKYSFGDPSRRNKKRLVISNNTTGSFSAVEHK